MVKRFIWDLGGTLLDGDFSKEEELFKANLSEEDFLKFNKQRWDLINAYEREYSRYNKKLLSDFLSIRSGVMISPDLIDKWIDYMINVNEAIHPGAVEVLDYLNNKGVENVVYSNWFRETHVGRLKKSGLDSYFKEIMGADHYMKPSREGFLHACGPYKARDCVMVGDNHIKDIEGARKAGLEAIYYCPKEDVNVPHIKRLVKIKEMLENGYGRY